jgi:hypothetical protein
MVEFRSAREYRDQALDYFWKHGATRSEGKVTLEGAWVATQDQIAPAVVKAADENEIVKACEPLRRFGETQYRLVTGTMNCNRTQ